jgi:Ser/Thr protein kinase RdoA (MazF antagonist)
VPHHQFRRALLPVTRSARLGLRAIDSLGARGLVRRVTGDDQLRIRSAVRTRGGIRIFAVDGESVGAAILKVAREPHASSSLRRESSALAAVREAVGEAPIRDLLPEVLDAGQADEWSYLLQRRILGAPATRAFADGPRGAHLLAQASRVAGDLHRITARRRSVTPEELVSWIHRPVALMGSLLGASSREHLEDVARQTITALPDHLSVGWIHGDFWSENILVDAAPTRITGIVDWDSAEAGGLGLHDRLHLVLYRRKRQHRVELGDEICSALTGRSDWEAAEADAVHGAIATLEVGTGPDAGRLAVVLYWLRVIAANLARQPALARRRAWVDPNIRQVLACL